LETAFDVKRLQDLAAPVAEFSARRWLAEQTGHPGEISTDAAQRLVAMATDAASPARQHFVGAILVRRRRGRIFAEITGGSTGLS
jgi:hypothetical protein